MLADLMARSAEENLALQWRGARLLLAIAGDAPEHIEMACTSQNKYYSQAWPLTLDDTLAHLQGRKTYGHLADMATERPAPCAMTPTPPTYGNSLTA